MNLLSPAITEDLIMIVLGSDKLKNLAQESAGI